MEAARDRIHEAAGSHFDRDVVATFLVMPIEVLQEARARLSRPLTQARRLQARGRFSGSHLRAPPAKPPAVVQGRAGGFARSSP